MNYDVLEQELVDKLNAYFDETNLRGDVLLNTVYKARLFPDNQVDLLEDYDHTLANVLYSDSTVGQPNAMDVISQDEFVHVHIYLQGSRVRGDKGVNGLTGHVIKALTGYRPTDALSGMYVSDWGGWRLNTQDGQVKPYIEFTFRTLIQQVFDNPIIDFIDREDTIVEGGVLAEVDSEVYQEEPAPENTPENGIGEVDIVLAEE
jgi:hypothetical protein